MSWLNTLGDINKLFGSGTTTGSQSGTSRGTETQQTELTPEAQMQIVRMMLENPSTGLQSVLGPGAASGTFGGSNQALMTSDLIARIAGQTALASAKTTKTAETTTTTGSQTKNTSPLGGLVKRVGKIFGF